MKARIKEVPFGLESRYSEGQIIDVYKQHKVYFCSEHNFAFTEYEIDLLDVERKEMNIRQSLTEYVQKKIQHHMETSGEGITAFCHRIGMQSQRVKGFLAGVTSLQLNTADRILKAIDEWKEYE